MKSIFGDNLGDNKVCIPSAKDPELFEVYELGCNGILEPEQRFADHAWVFEKDGYYIKIDTNSKYYYSIMEDDSDWGYSLIDSDKDLEALLTGAMLEYDVESYPGDGYEKFPEPKSKLLYRFRKITEELLEDSEE